MAIPIEMPKMSDTMEEGVLVSWQAEEGDQVSAGDVIAQVETDKATMDLEVYDDGVLLKRVIKEGDAVPIGGLIAVLGEKGEDVTPILKKYQGNGEGAAAPAEEKETQVVEEAGSAPGGDGAPTAATEPEPPVEREGDGRIKSSPLARRMAREHGIELTQLQGSGPEGRIIKRDVVAVLGEGAAAPARAPVAEAPAVKAPPIPQEEGEGYKVQRITQMRKTIARRLAQSKFTAPHFYLTVDVDMDSAAASRQRVNGIAEKQKGPKISFNDLITKACALALRQHPQVNSSYLENEGEIRTHNQVHVAVAVALPEGLVTPVIRNADRKSLSQIAVETRALAEKARNRELQPADWEGSTFTTSNLGMYGIEEFTAIINPPNACILAIGAVRDVPVVKNDAVVPGKRMKLTLSCDHRIVDGATGSEFLSTVAQYLEEPLTMLL